jgi:hypothetical protein
VFSVAALSLAEVLVEWCDVAELQAHKCKYSAGRAIYYFYGSGSLPGSSSSAPFVWVGEVALAKGVKNGAITILQKDPWRLVVTDPAHKLKLLLTSNLDLNLVVQLALRYVAW